MGLVNGHYVYWKDLHHLVTATSSLPYGGLDVLSPSPIALPCITYCLRSYPNPRFAIYLAQGLSEGFCWARGGGGGGGGSGQFEAQPTARNHPSFESLPDAIHSYIVAEREAGYSRATSSWCACESYWPGPIWGCLEDDLSYPRGGSLNDLMSPDVCSLSYPSVNDAVDFIVLLGHYIQLVRIEI